MVASGPSQTAASAARIADRDERRQAEPVAMVPAFGDHFRADPGGIAERDRQRSDSERVIALTSA